MEGGDNLVQVPQTVIQAENSESETARTSDKPEDIPEILTDSTLDDDLVVIPEQGDHVEISSKESAQPDIVNTQPAVQAEPQTQTQTQTQPQDPVTDQPAAPRPKTSPISRNSKPPMEPKHVKPTEDDDDDEDIEDETLAERLWGLTDMFPEGLRRATGVTVGLSFSGMQKLFNFTRSALWIGSTSFMILILPVVFETEMVHMEQAQIQRQKQILLGPNAATAGAMTGGLTPPIPGVAVAPPPT